MRLICFRGTDFFVVLLKTILLLLVPIELITFIGRADAETGRVGARKIELRCLSNPDERTVVPEGGNYTKSYENFSLKNRIKSDLTGRSLNAPQIVDLSGSLKAAFKLGRPFLLSQGTSCPAFPPPDYSSPTPVPGACVDTLYRIGISGHIRNDAYDYGGTEGYDFTSSFDHLGGSSLTGQGTRALFYGGDQIGYVSSGRYLTASITSQTPLNGGSDNCGADGLPIPW